MTKSDKKFLISIFRKYKENEEKVKAAEERITLGGGGYDNVAVQSSPGNRQEDKVINYIDDKDYYSALVAIVMHTQYYCAHDKIKMGILKYMLLSYHAPAWVSFHLHISISQLYYIREDILNYAYEEAYDLHILKKY